LNQLVSMENVTERVLSAVKPGSPEKQQNEQRKAEMARVEKESSDKTGLRSDVVELYQGGEYWLYRYKKYTDIRLVMAPEAQAAFYGGDPDNFTYPRYDLDFAFFRVYENGKPAKPAHWFKWSESGAKDGELVFVLGHPGHTDRLKTTRQLELERDSSLPLTLKMLRQRHKAFDAYSARGAEQRRRAKDRIFGIENAVKALSGELEGLQSDKLFSRLAAQERQLREKVAADPKLSKDYGAAWDKIAKAQDELEKRHKQQIFRGFYGSKLAGFATTIVRYVAE